MAHPVIIQVHNSLGNAMKYTFHQAIIRKLQMSFSISHDFNHGSMKKKILNILSNPGAHKKHVFISDQQMLSDDWHPTESEGKVFVFGLFRIAFLLVIYSSIIWAATDESLANPGYSIQGSPVFFPNETYLLPCICVESRSCRCQAGKIGV